VFKLKTRITDLDFVEHGSKNMVASIRYECAGELADIRVGASDRILVRLGSMTEGSRFGGTDRPPERRGKDKYGAWAR
jgi:oleate hydratase